VKLLVAFRQQVHAAHFFVRSDLFDPALGRAWEAGGSTSVASASTTVARSRMAWTTDHSHIVIHHLAKGLHAGSQAKQLEARRNVSQRLDLQSSRRNGRECSRSIHGVAFLCGISTPSLSAQGEQRRSAFFNIRRDIGLLRTHRG
jgi:hypothetical protein